MQNIENRAYRNLMVLGLAAGLGSAGASAEDVAGSYSLPTLYVQGQQTANVLPVSTYAAPVSNLEFEPRVDLQSRNMAEAQGDVSIRGGIFENTGFRLGAATLLDPQTGHYFAELPVAPEMLSRPAVLTGADNALLGFNSTAGTLDYGWTEIRTGGSLTVGFGDHDLNTQRLHSGFTGALGDSGDWSWGVEGEYSRSESDGTVRYGDHDFYRANARVQLLGPNSQTDFFAGYQEKFFGWPELYAAPYGAMETDNLKNRLFLFNHKQSYGDASTVEFTAYTRRLSDHYIFNRFAPNKAFVHETQVHAAALSGRHAFSERSALNYNAQLTADEIDSTTLENNFTSRSYLKLALLPEYNLPLNDAERLRFRAGLAYDDSNRDDDAVSPIADLAWFRDRADGGSDKLYLSYAEASQVPGYTATGGGSAGLFASDPDLDRETSRNVELGGRLERLDWSFEAAVFYRWDDDLVDWTYSDANTSARSASNVDIETLGVELIASYRWGDLEAIASYGYLHKDEDYGDASVDASFYALNFPEHRVTLGAIWRPIDLLEVRIDNEWRQQEASDLREGSDCAFFTHLRLSVFPPQIKQLELFVAVDNLWDDDFQDVPGTPGRGDQYSAGATWRW
ncbi:TonB-dependent receptor plug domain-containing protein [Coraliomargarita parva]|uniref:TonB-dependent receptor plug domain-containing protein n=1 Tax=Coraliomargarita parva TaxID=3014050 RepID=UPI0022B4B5B1|nr:TonB-dependent receptor [Coraliomargarita parva]